MKTNMHTYLKKFSEQLFNELKSNEELTINLHSEESDFVRFNQSKIRQNTSVNQHELVCVYQSEQRQYKCTLSLSLDFDFDIKNAKDKLNNLREQLPQTDTSLKYNALVNNGTSAVYKKSERPDTEEIIKIITSTFSDCDLAGFWSSGPLRQASLNSKGQFHYFENDSFFFDYSLYNGPRAAKGFFSEPNWNEKDFLAKAQQTKNTLSLLSKPQIQAKPGAYAAYLEPMAVAEIMGIFNWKALSRSAFEQGFAPLKNLHSEEKYLSEKFTLIENNQLGLDSHFNSLGEKVPDQLTLIENGKLKNFLTSSATAKEYNLTSNQAEPYEQMRSFEIRAGTLEHADVLKKLDKGLYISNLHYINWSDVQTARITGMTRFACFWVENGEIIGPIQDLRFDDSLFNILGSQLRELTSHQEIFTSIATYQKREKGGMKVSGLLLNQFNFTL